jgi:hypothetical protein
MYRWLVAIELEHINDFISMCYRVYPDAAEQLDVFTCSVMSNFDAVCTQVQV